MAAAATEVKKNLTTDDLLLHLGDGDAPAAECAAKFGRDVLARAWVRGEIEFGRPKHVVTGSPDGKREGPTLVLEDGTDWGGAKTARHARLADVLAAAMPACKFHQRYQREVCVNPRRDVWEWLGPGEDAAGRETRWARRDCTPDEAAARWELRVQLTDKGMAAVQTD
jgi:hypothetical protein